MLKVLRGVEKAIVIVLMVLMVVVAALATGELGWLIVKDILTPPILLLGIDEILDIFGFFLLVLIGVELLSSLSAYLSEHVIHVEVVVEIAIIAIGRKVIILDLKEIPGLTMVGIAAIIAGLTGALYAIRRWQVGKQVSAPVGSEPTAGGDTLRGT